MGKKRGFVSSLISWSNKPLLTPEQIEEDRKARDTVGQGEQGRPVREPLSELIASRIPSTFVLSFSACPRQAATRREQILRDRSLRALAADLDADIARVRSDSRAAEMGCGNSKLPASHNDELPTNGGARITSIPKKETAQGDAHHSVKVGSAQVNAADLSAKDVPPTEAASLDEKYADEREKYNLRIDRALRLAAVASMDILDRGTEQETQEEWEARLMRNCGYDAGALPEHEHPEPGEEGIESFAMKLYSECDIDHNLSLDRIEIRPLVQMLFDKRPDIAKGYGHNIDRMVDDVMSQVDDDGSNSLDYVEFLFLLACHPWITLVPPALREDLDHLVERKERERASANLSR